MEMPRPGAEQRKLEILVGSWRGDETLSPSPWDPKGGTAVGRTVNRLALDGFAVIQDYQQQREGQTNFLGHGVFRWDDGTYVLHWFDSMGMAPSEYRGNFDGNTLVMTARLTQGFSRATFDFRRPGSYHFRMEVSPDGNQWFTMIDGQYIRTD